MLLLHHLQTKRSHFNNFLNEEVNVKYLSGEEVRLGDVVKISEGVIGVVVCSIDTNEYTSEFTIEDWSYLEKGVLVNSEVQGLTHITEPDEDLELISRK